MAGEVKERYPLVPKSNAYLRPGQFWDIPLSDGRHAAGIVVATPSPEQASRRRMGTRLFVAGLLGWSGDNTPTVDNLIDRPLVTWGYAHINSITREGGQILGRLGQVPGAIAMLSHRFGGVVRRQVNGVYDGPATSDELQRLPVESTWGLKVAGVLAELIFVKHRPFINEVGSPIPHAKLLRYVNEDGQISESLEPLDIRQRDV